MISQAQFIHLLPKDFSRWGFSLDVTELVPNLFTLQKAVIEGNGFLLSYLKLKRTTVLYSVESIDLDEAATTQNSISLLESRGALSALAECLFETNESDLKKLHGLLATQIDSSCLISVDDGELLEVWVFNDGLAGILRLKQGKVVRLSFASVAHLVAAEADGFSSEIWGEMFSPRTEKFITNVLAATKVTKLNAASETSLLSALSLWGYDVRRTKPIILLATGIFKNPLFQCDPQKMS